MGLLSRRRPANDRLAADLRAHLPHADGRLDFRRGWWWCPCGAPLLRDEPTPEEP